MESTRHEWKEPEGEDIRRRLLLLLTVAAVALGWQSLGCPEGCAVPTGTLMNYLLLDPVVGVFGLRGLLPPGAPWF